MRHTISAHAGLPREESYSPLSEVLLSQKSSLLSVPDPEQPTDLIKLALPSARDIVLAVLEWGKHHLHFYLSKSGMGYRMSSSHTLSVLHSPYISVCTGDFCKKDTQYKNSSPGETTAVSGHSPFLHTGLRARVWRLSHPGASNTEGTLVRPWVEIIWKNKLSPDILVLTKALAEHWRGRDWLKSCDN